MNARFWLILLLLAAGPLVAQTFTSTPNVAIPDNDPNGVTNTITVPATSDRVRSLRVGVRINHTYDADLYLFLLPPGVTWNPPYTTINNGPVIEPPPGVVTLSTKNGGGGDNYGSGSGGGTVYTNFRSSRDPVLAATTSIRSGAAPFTSQTRWIPELEYAFDNLYGTNPSGDWTLIVVDGWAIDTGTLVSWQVEYTPVTSPALIARLSPANQPGSTVVTGAADQVLGHFEFEGVGAGTLTSVIVRSENGVALNTSFSRIALHEDLNNNGVLDPGETQTMTGTLTPGASTITLSFGAPQAMPAGVTRRFLLVGDVLGTPAASGISMQILQASDFVATAARSGLFPIRAGFHRIAGPRTYTSAPLGGSFMRDAQAFGVRSTIVIPATDDLIGGVRVGIRLDHNRMQDVDCYLLPPGVDWNGPYTSGAPPAGVIDMSTDNGGNGDNFGTGAANGPYVFTFFSTNLDPTWPTNNLITGGAAPFTLAAGYRPEGQAAWNALYGTNPAGSWTLVVADDAGGGGNAGGTLLAWTVEYLAHPKAELTGVQDFGSSVVGATSAVSPRTFTISNEGDYPLSVTGINFSGAAPADFALTPAPAFPFNVPAGGSVNFNASFTPTAQGVRSASLDVVCNDDGLVGSAVPINVWGFGNMPPSVTLNAGFANAPGTPFKRGSNDNVAGQYEFATGSTGATINTVTFTEAAGRVLLNNLSALRLMHDADNSGTLTPGDVLLATATLAPASTTASFTVNRVLAPNTFENWILVADVLASPANNAIAFRVASGADVTASLAVMATFPQDTGPHPLDSARVFTSTPTGGIGIPNASTAGITNSIVIPPTTETVAALRIGLRIDHPADQDLDIYLIPPGVTWAGPYTGAGPAGVIELTSDNGGTGDDYGSGTDDIVYANLTRATDPVFQPGANIAGQGAGAAPFTSQYYYVEDAADMLLRYGASPAGTWTLAVVDDAGDAFSTGRLISWQVEYLPPGIPEVTGLADWGGSTVGVLSGFSPQTYTITNIGAIDLTVTNIALTGTHAADWSFAGPTGTPVALAPAATHDVQLNFTPGAAGPRNANLVVTYNTGTQTGLTRTFTLSGAGITVPGVIGVTTPVNFGNVNLGSSSAPTPITINNTGAGNLTLNSINTAFAGHTGDWSFSALPPFPHVITPGGNLTFNATFTPTAAGPRSMTIRVTSNTGGAAGTTTDIVLNGTGVALPGLIGVTTPVNFGSVNLGSSSAATPISINNTGAGSLTISAINTAFAGHTGDWGFAGLPALPAVIGPGGNVQFNATFTPTAAGARSMTLRVTSDSNGVPGTTTDIVLNGTGLQGLISVTTPVNFGSVNLGSSSAATPIQINNVGTGDLTLSALNLAFAGHTGDWGFTGAPTPPTVIPAGGNIQFNATFTPTAAGARSMTIRVTSNNAGVPGTTTDIVLNGTGLQGLISVTTPVNFGGVNLGSSSAATPIQINNIGTGDLTLSALNLAFAGHTTDWGFTGAPTPPTVIPAGGNIQFNATFTPTAAGARSMTIRVTSNDAGVPGTTTDIVLNGNGLQGLISVTTPVNFGSVNLGSSSAATPITINNVGSGDLTISALNLAFAGHIGDWGFTGAPTPPTVIPAGGNVQFNATFTPTAAGARSMTIRVTSNDAGVPGTNTDIVLNGNGLQGLISVTTPINFGSVNLGSSSAATPITINNVGTGDLTLSALDLAFAGHTGDWGFTGAPTPPTVIPAGGNIQFNATFTPTAAGARSMTIRVTSNDAGVPGTTTDIVLDGNGLQGLISVTSPVNFGSVNLGLSSAATPIQINNVGTGDLTLSALNLAFAGHTGDWGFTGAPTPPTVIPAGGNIQFNATFTPTAAGARSMTIRVTSNDAGVPGTNTDIVLNGNGLQGLISVTTPVNFGSVNLGSSSAATPIQINNVGTGDLTLSALNLAFAGHTADWGFTGAPTPPTVIPAGGNVQFNATFTPTAAGARSMTIRVTSNDAGVPGSTTDVVLNGNGLQGLISVTTPVNFGSVNLGSSAAATPITINNVGTGDLTLSALNLAFAGHTADWGFTGAPTPPTVIPAGGNVQFNATFTPTAAGARSMVIRVTSNDAGVPGTNTDIVLNGNGLQGLISVTTPINFGSVNLGSSSAATPITINNVGTGDLTLSALDLAFAGHTGDWGFTGAPTPPTVIPAGGNIQFNATFTPTAAGARSMTIRVTSNDAGVPGTTTDIVLDGNGLQGLISVTSPVNFGSVNLGLSSAATPIQINNVGTGDLTLSALNLAFAGHTGDWGFTGAPTPPTVIPAGGNIQFNATFTPTAAGARSMTIRVTSNDAGVPGTTTDIVLNGSGLQGLISVTTPVNFGSVNLGSSSAATPITINNVGTGDLTLSALNLAFAGHTGDWGFTGAPTPPTVIPAGGNVQFNATFSPTVSGPRSMSLRITSNSSGVPGTTTDITLNGTGTVAVSVTGVTISADTGGPLTVQATVNGTGPVLADIHVTYDRGLGAQAAYILDAPGFVVSGNVIEDVPAGTTVTFRWDAYATERHVTGNYTLTLAPFVGVNPGVSGSAVRTLQRQGGWARHSAAVSAPTGVFGHTMVYDSVNDRFVVFAGKRNNVRTNETWVYERNAAFAAGWQRLNIAGTPPSPVQYHNAIYESANERMLVFGGFNDATGYTNQLWQLNLTRGSESWLLVGTGSPAFPSARYGSAFIIDEVNERAILFGGIGGTGNMNDAWQLSLAGGGATWAAAAMAPLGTAPTGRWGMAGVFDSVNNRLVIYGGYGPTGQTDEVHELTLGVTPTWAQITPTGTAGARYFASYTHDAAGNTLIVQSGYRSGTILRDVWQLALSGPSAHTWTELAADDNAGIGRVTGAGAFDTSRDQAAFFGGLGTGGFALTALSLLSTSGAPAWQSGGVATGEYPHGRWGHMLVHDHVGHDRLILWGGKDNSTYFTELWVMDRSLPEPAWALMSVPGVKPAARVYMAYAYDAAGDRLLVHGGIGASNNTLGDLWQLDLSLATPVWTQLASGPAARYLHQVAIDTTLNRMFLFGGWTTTYSNETWSYDLAGNTWTLLAPTGGPPAARQAHGLVYDSSWNRLVAFGGVSAAGRLNDVWALDLTSPGSESWGDISAGGFAMPPTAYFAYAMHPTLTDAYVHGGETSAGASFQMWRLDLSGFNAAWWPVAHGGGIPIERKHHQATFDSAGNLYMGYGYADFQAVADLWVMDTSNTAAGWSDAHNRQAPGGMASAAAAYDPVGNRMIAFGGLTGNAHQGGMFQLDLGSPVAQWTPLDATGTWPSPRRAATMVYDNSSVPPRMILYGGRQGIAHSTISNQVWALNLGVSPSWQLLATSANPGPRANHVAVVAGGFMYIWGGMDQTGTYRNDVRRLDLGTLAWSTVTPSGTVPTARVSPGAVYDAPRNRIVFFGGHTGSGTVNQLVELDLGAMDWATLAPGGTVPAARLYHVMVHDAAGQRAVIHGGVLGSAAYADLYTLDLTTDTFTQIAPPVAIPQGRWQHAGVWDSAVGRLAIAGGYAGSGVEALTDGAADTWFWGD